MPIYELQDVIVDGKQEMQRRFELWHRHTGSLPNQMLLLVALDPVYSDPQIA